ncbi:MAG: serine/threonine-protein kinase, partial [Bradymonadaceae bacterium]
MGEIWQGRHLEQDVQIAVKVVRHQAERSKDFEALFVSEVEAVASLHHPSIVCVHDYGKITRAAAAASGERLIAGSPYLVMELAGHGSLHDRPRPESWPELRHILLQILDGLAHAHAHHLYHCDLKPGNVLVTATTRAGPTLKLTDFGLSHLTTSKPSKEDDGGQHISAGTPGYMAPEQIHGRRREIGPWTDLYALGSMVYDLAVGRLPFVHSNPLRMMVAHLQDQPGPFEPRFDVPVELEEWVRRLLAKSPGARFLRAADAAHTLWRMSEPNQTMASGECSDVDRPDDGSQDTLVELGTLTTLLAWTPGTTLLSENVSANEDAPPFESRPASYPHAPPMAERWEVKEAPPGRLLSGTGLGLFRLRRTGFVGREDDRDAIWSELARVGEEGRPRAMVLTGSMGSGKTALAQWMARRADELGAAIVLYADHSLIGGPREGLGRMLSRFLRAEGLFDEELEAFEEGRLEAFLPDLDSR